MTSRAQMILFGLLFMAVGAVMVFLFGQTTELRCSKPETRVTTCELKRKLLGLVTISTKELQDVNNAFLDESCDDDGCTYRVVLLAGTNKVPMTGYYSSGWKAKREKADQITQYVRLESEEPLLVKEQSGMFGALFSFAFVLVGLYVVIVKGLFNPGA